MGLIINRKATKKFKVISCKKEPVIQFISSDKKIRENLYEEFKRDNIILPEYSRFKRSFFNKKDLVVLKEDFDIAFKYNEKAYHFVAKKGFCYDATSIPLIISYGRLSKINQYNLIGATFHDAAFALKLFSRVDSDNIFDGLLKFKKMFFITRWFHLLGLRLFGWLVYNKKEDKPWCEGFVELDIIGY